MSVNGVRYLYQGKENTECAICKDDITKGQDIAGHDTDKFHHDCLKQWFQTLVTENQDPSRRIDKKASCPLCKATFIQATDSALNTLITKVNASTRIGRVNTSARINDVNALLYTAAWRNWTSHYINLMNRPSHYSRHVFLGGFSTSSFLPPSQSTASNPMVQSNQNSTPVLEYYSCDFYRCND